MGWIRAFLAVDIEDPRLVSEIGKIQQEILGTGNRLTLVKPGNMHYTVKFLGRTDSALVPEIERSVRNLGLSAFPIIAGDLGAFPTPARPRVIWIGAKQGREEFSELMSRVEEALSWLGFERERRKPVPHATLARVKRLTRPGPLKRIISKLSDVEIGQMSIGEIRVKSSVLTPGGPIYETLASVRLG